ncbi:EamA family transporter [Thermopolyspora sp. NPDC052614]|uniref:DMT family transporter n=1 Tax=Thermopolyspora sp. NPDC052614 TaxID=3155682 RepID=UPI00343B8460
MRSAGPWAIIAAAVLWGTAGTAGTLAMAGGVDASPLDLAAARLVIGGLVLGVLLTVGARGRVLRTGMGWRMLFATVAVVAYQLCFFAAVDRTGVAIGTVVAIGSGPVFTGLLSWYFDRTRPSARWAGATAAAIAGCALLIAGGGVEAGRDVVTGVLLALLGGLLYAYYAVTAAGAIALGAPSGLVMGQMFGGGAILSLPLLSFGGIGWLSEPYGLLTAVYLGCATTALAYFLYGRGLRTTPVATAATLALAEPAVAAVLGLVVLGERLSPSSWAGMAMLGLALVAVARSTASAPEPATGPATERAPEPALGSGGEPGAPDVKAAGADVDSAYRSGQPRSGRSATKGQA